MVNILSVVIVNNCITAIYILMLSIKEADALFGLMYTWQLSPSPASVTFTAVRQVSVIQK